VSLIVFGAENRNVYVLDSNALDVIVKCEVASVPSFLACSGVFEIEYRIVVACRDGKIYTIKNGQLLSMVIELETPPVGLVKIDKTIYVGCMDNVVYCFHFKGKKMSSLFLDHPIRCMCDMESPKTKTKALLVALRNGEIKMFNGKFLVHTLELHQEIMGMCFGTFGREEGTLCVSLKNGGLMVKMLSRNANIDMTSTIGGPPKEQDVPLDVPKKTKLYVDQTAREREQPVEMHRVFQRDLCKLRLSTARAYVKLLDTNHASAGVRSTGNVHLSLTAVVKGMGPEFQLRTHLSTDGDAPLRDLLVIAEANSSVYKIKRPAFYVPVLVPSYCLAVAFEVESLTQAVTDAVRISVILTDKSRPVVTALVQMPTSEPFLLTD